MSGIVTYTAVTVRLDPSALRSWQIRLIKRLETEAKLRVSVCWGQAAWTLPPATILLFSLESLIHRIPAGGPMGARTKNELATYEKPDPTSDLTLDFCGDLTESATPVWQVLFNGGCGEGAALASLIDGLPPFVELREAASGKLVASAHPGTEYPGVITKAFADIMARTTTLILAALSGRQLEIALPVLVPKASSSQDIAAFSAKGLVRNVALRLYHLCYYTPHWKVGWRFTGGGPSLLEAGQHPASGWNVLADDGRHFYADPFPLLRDGKYQVFVEDFDQRLGYGVISAIAFDRNGPVGPAKTVLDTGSHLSYPFVFEAEGEVWMVPESSSARKLELYRAQNYPGHWVRESILLDDNEISDATLFEHDGRWWMMATVRDEGGSYSDSLQIWSAPNFRGPWIPLSGHPAFIDIARARPAGRVINVNGSLVRPVQDCTANYGHSLAFAEITRLDMQGFSQKIVAQLFAGPLWPGRRLHTYNKVGQLETIDGSSTGRKFF